VIIRSSSHPPASERGADSRDVSGARALPTSHRPAGAEDEGAEARSKRSTPAERPRRRRKIRAERAAEPTTAPRTSGAERPHPLGARRSTPDRLVSTRAEQLAARTRRARGITIAIAVAIAILLGAGLWLLRR
jgi:hypothetical protein